MAVMNELARMRKSAFLCLGVIAVLSACSPRISDGFYEASFDAADPNGWRPQLILEVADGEILRVDYDEFDIGGRSKKRDGHFHGGFNDEASMPRTVFSRIEGYIRAGESLEELGRFEASSYAETLLTAIREASALGAEGGELESGGTVEIRSVEPLEMAMVLPMNATYVIREFDADPWGFTAELQLSYENGVVSAASYEETNNRGESKAEADGLLSQMRGASGGDWVDARDALVQSIVERGPDAELSDLDAVSGATQLYDRFRMLTLRVDAFRTTQKGDR